MLFCSDLIDVRQTHFNVDSWKVVLKEIFSEFIFNILKKINICFISCTFLIKKDTFGFNFELFDCINE